MSYSAVIFDLDGTLLDTLGDLTDALNFALCAHALPQHGEPDVRAWLGNGIRRLVESAVPPGTPPALTDAVFEAFKLRYGEHYLDRTVPYPGMVALCRALQARGIPTALVTNKADFVAQRIYVALFAGVIPVAIGEQPGFAKKPAPDMVDEALRRLGCGRQRAVYVGDSEVDLLTAQNSGLPCILVDWGFRDRSFLETLGSHPIVSTADELLRAICG